MAHLEALMRECNVILYEYVLDPHLLSSILFIPCILSNLRLFQYSRYHEPDHPHVPQTCRQKFVAIPMQLDFDFGFESYKIPHLSPAPRLAHLGDPV